MCVGGSQPLATILARVYSGHIANGIPPVRRARLAKLTIRYIKELLQVIDRIVLAVAREPKS